MAVAVENWVAMVVGVRRVFGSEGAALGCCYTGAFEGMGLIRADSGGEDPGYADMLACRRGRAKAERSQRRVQVEADSRAWGAVRLSALGTRFLFGVVVRSRWPSIGS